MAQTRCSLGPGILTRRGTTVRDSSRWLKNVFLLPEPTIRVDAAVEFRFYMGDRSSTRFHTTGWLFSVAVS